MEARGPSQDQLTSIVRRVMAENRVNVDPFTLMEFMTVLRPLMCIDLKEILSDKRSSRILESARLTLARLFRRLGVKDPEEKALKVTAEVLREVANVAACGEGR